MTISFSSASPSSSDSSPLLWLVEFTVPFSHAETYVTHLEELGESISWDEFYEGKEVIWKVHLYVDGTVDKEKLSQEVSLRLSLTSLLAQIPEPTFTIEEVFQKDWVLESYAAFPPLMIGGYYIHGSHIKPPASLGDEMTCLQIEAATAFGSGKHATTHGCIELLTSLKEEGLSFSRPVDIGCGSGILAMVIATTWPGTSVLAIDNDPIAVTVTEENAHINGLSSQIIPLLAEGLDHPQAQEKGPFDLITANILANPLCEMAPHLAPFMASGGILILSGFLVDQAEGVRKAYEEVGFFQSHEIEREGWVTLGMKKS